MLNKKPYIEDHKKTAEIRLSARVEVLKAKGMTPVEIQKDSKVKHFRAEIRKARYQLEGIATLESQIAQQAEIKAKKLAAPKIDHPNHKRSVPNPEKKRAKKERKLAAAADETE